MVKPYENKMFDGIKNLPGFPKLPTAYEQVYKINQEIAGLEEKRNRLIQAHLDANEISYQEFERNYGFVYQQLCSDGCLGSLGKS